MKQPFATEAKEKAKKVVKDTTKQTYRFTMNAIKIIFIVIIVYTIGISVYAFFTGSEVFLQNVATISVGGFWAFFLGYFGWKLAQKIEEFFIGVKDKL